MSLTGHTKPECKEHAVVKCQEAGHYLRLGGTVEENVCTPCPDLEWKPGDDPYATACIPHPPCPEGTAVFEPSLLWKVARRVCTQTHTLTFTFPGVVDKGFYDHAMQYVAPDSPDDDGSSGAPDPNWSSNDSKEQPYGGESARERMQHEYGARQTYHDYLHLAVTRAITEKLLTTSDTTNADKSVAEGEECEVCKFRDKPFVHVDDFGYSAYLHPGELERNAGSGGGDGGGAATNAYQYLIAQDGGEMRVNTVEIQSSSFVAKLHAGSPEEHATQLRLVEDNPLQSLKLQPAEIPFGYADYDRAGGDNGGYSNEGGMWEGEVTDVVYASPPWLGYGPGVQSQCYNELCNCPGTAAFTADAESDDMAWCATTKGESGTGTDSFAVCQSNQTKCKGCSGVWCPRRKPYNVIQGAKNYGADAAVLTIRIVTSTTSSNETILISRAAANDMNTKALEKYLNGDMMRFQRHWLDKTNNQITRRAWYDAFDREHDTDIRFSGLAAGMDSVCVAEGEACAGVLDACEEMGISRQDKDAQQFAEGSTDESLNYNGRQQEYPPTGCSFANPFAYHERSGDDYSSSTFEKAPIWLRIRKICGSGLVCQQMNQKQPNPLDPYVCVQPGKRNRERARKEDHSQMQWEEQEMSPAAATEAPADRSKTYSAVQVALVFPPLEDVREMAGFLARGQASKGITYRDLRSAVKEACIQFTRQPDAAASGGLKCILASITHPVDISGGASLYPIERDHRGYLALDKDGYYDAFNDSDISTFTADVLDSTPVDKSKGYAVFARILIEPLDGKPACSAGGATLRPMQIQSINGVAVSQLVQRFGTQQRFNLAFPGIVSGGLYDTRMQLDNSRATSGLFQEKATDAWNTYCYSDDEGNWSSPWSSPCNGRQNILKDSALAAVAEHYADHLDDGRVHSIVALTSYWRPDNFHAMRNQQGAFKPTEAEWASNYGADAAFVEITVHGHGTGIESDNPAAGVKEYNAAIAEMNRHALLKYGLGSSGDTNKKGSKEVLTNTRMKGSVSRESWVDGFELGFSLFEDAAFSMDGWERTTFPAPGQPVCAGAGGLCNRLAAPESDVYAFLDKPYGINETMFLSGKDEYGWWREARVNVNGYYTRSLCNEQETCTPFARDQGRFVDHGHECVPSENCEKNIANKDGACSSSECRPTFIFAIPSAKARGDNGASTMLVHSEAVGVVTNTFVDAFNSYLQNTTSDESTFDFDPFNRDGISLLAIYKMDRKGGGDAVLWMGDQDDGSKNVVDLSSDQLLIKLTAK